MSPLTDLQEIRTSDGYLTWRAGSGNTVEVYDIAVTSERRKGHGEALMRLLFRRLPVEIRLVFAITRADNFVAQQFYEALGFRVVAPLRHFYQDGTGKPTIDAVMYGRDVGDQTRGIK